MGGGVGAREADEVAAGVRAATGDVDLGASHLLRGESISIPPT